MNQPLPQTWRPPIARRQAQTFTTAQAIAAGLSRRQVGYRIQAGSLVRVAGNALRLKTEPVTPQMLVHAAHLTWPDSIPCGPTVSALFGAPLTVFEAHIIADDKRRDRLNLKAHLLPIEPDQCTVWQGITVTSPTRSLIDSLVLLPDRSARSLFAWAKTRNRLGAVDLEEHLAQNPGRRGNARLRRFLESATKGFMSPAEELAHEILRGAGFTGWQADATISDESGFLARVDILFTAKRVVVEIDGRQFHGPDRFQADRTRDNLLLSAGYRVLRFTWEDLTRRPHILIERLQQVLGT